jgi:hypothetical protein
MPAAKLDRFEKLEKELGSNIHTESVNINVSKGTRLYNEIKRLLKKRHHVSEIKGIALL